MGRRFDVILLDVDGTLLDFNRSEALGIRRLLEHFGIEPLPEYLEAYHRINEGYWKAFERGGDFRRTACDGAVCKLF